nr:DUF488 family protein [Caulobacteraceae bacterium]
HLEEPRAQAQLARAGEIAAARAAALLCYEADAARCHRAILAERIGPEIGRVVVDL